MYFDTKLRGSKRLLRAFVNSFNGFRISLQESAFKQELTVCICLIPVAIFSEKSWLEKALLLLALGLVLLTEVLNTALELVVDRIGLEFNETSKKAKDVGSFAVFIAILLACLVWILAFF